MRKLYVVSKDRYVLEKKGVHLIGVLTELDSGYRFEYKFGESTPHGVIGSLAIREFPDVSKVWEGESVNAFVKRLVPRKEGRFIQVALETAGLEEYDEWELLKFYGTRNAKEDAYLFEELPENLVIYE